MWKVLPTFSRNFSPAKITTLTLDCSVNLYIIHVPWHFLKINVFVHCWKIWIKPIRNLLSGKYQFFSFLSEFNKEQNELHPVFPLESCLSDIGRFLCHLWSIAAHEDHFVLCLSVCLSGSHPWLCFAGHTCIPWNAAILVRYTD